MGKYTKQEVIDGRKSGLSKWDKAVKVAGRDKVIEHALELNSKFPNIWSAGWGNLHWAFVNAVNELANTGGMHTWNLDEALTPQEMSRIQQDLGLGEYTPVWHRKVQKNPNPAP